MRSVLRGTLSAILAAVLVLLFLTSALAGLRSPSGTDRAGAALAADPTVRRVVVDVATDAAVERLERGPLPLGPLLPILRPLFAEVLATVLATETGEALLADTLADVVQQVSFGPPLVLDLRPALAAALEIAPAPLAVVADELLFDDAAGLLLIDADGVRAGGTTEVAALRTSRSTSLVGALSDRLTLILLATASLLLTTALVLLQRNESGRAGAPAGVLLAVSLPVALALTFAPGALTRALARTSMRPVTGADDATSELVDALLPIIAEQFSQLLGPTRLVAILLAAVSIVSLAIVHLGHRAGD
jgi:hypothetical protein